MVTSPEGGFPASPGKGNGNDDGAGCDGCDGCDGEGNDGSGDGGLSEAFDALFCELLQRLYKRAAMLVGSRLTAEDAVHEVYLKLAARPQNLLRHPEPYAYAFAALLSVVKDTWRRERRQVLMADVDPAATGSGSSAWDGGVESRAAELEVVRLLRQLSTKQAGAVVLVDLDGYTIDQAAEILHVHRGTVARSRARALRKLRGALNASSAAVPSGASGSAVGGTGRVVRESHES